MRIPSVERVQSILMLHPSKRSAVYWSNAAVEYEQRGDALCAACAWAAAHFVMPDHEPFAERSVRCMLAHEGQHQLEVPE